jgi:peptide/nickel transport system substrate-binding protein
MTLVRTRLALMAALTALLAGCWSQDEPKGPVRVSIIGPQPHFAPIGRDEAPAPQATLLLAAAQGLVTLDASGRIEPGLAQRWIVSDDGLSYIFRLRRAEWQPGRPVTSDQLARILRVATAPDGRNRLAPFFSAVDEVVAVTPEILEIRLKHPRPHFLDLLTQPEMGFILRGAGSGPYRISGNNKRVVTLAPIADPDFPDEQQARYPVSLRAERASRALSRYDRGSTDLVLGGSFADLAIARALDPPANQLRFDPARGLFGLAVTSQEGFLESAENRAAIAMAIDRDALVSAFAVPGWRPMLSMVPDRLELPRAPVMPEWAALPLAERIAIARARVAAWRGNNAEFPRLSIALPDGPGSRLLFTRIALDLGRIGIIAQRVPANGPADLRLIDAVAPNDSATWYLTRLSCEAGLPCGETGQQALTASRAAPSLAERAARLAEADAAYAVNTPFIPLATPLRWSLVRPSLRGFHTNNRAAHPLNRLLND